MFVGAGHGSYGSLQSTDHSNLSEMHDIEKVFVEALGDLPKLYFWQHCQGTGSKADKKPWPALKPDAEADGLGLKNSFRFYGTAMDFYAYRVAGDSPFLAAVMRATGTCKQQPIEKLEDAIVEEFGNPVQQVPQIHKDMGAKWTLP